MKLMIIYFFSIIMITTIFSLIGLTDLNIKAFAIADSDSFLTYNNSKFNFSIQYPSTWDISENKFHPALKNISSTIEITSPFEGFSKFITRKISY